MKIDASWRLMSPRGGGAVAVVQIHGDVDAALERLGIAAVPVGGVVLRPLCGVDRGLVARWTESSAQLMSHGGAAVVRGILAALNDAGLSEAGLDPLRGYSGARRGV